MLLKITAVILALTLVTTNAFWFYKAIDQGVSLSYTQDSATSECRALSQVLEVLPQVAANTPKKQIVDAAAQAAKDDVPFEKEGGLWVGHIGLFFEGDRLVKVKRSWSPSFCEWTEDAP
ncbi:MAG: hypothetical protein MK135_12770 [Polyangiaceae bacterium]|nr:hypothetical protein [Polyangiaceae bacterium]